MPSDKVKLFNNLPAKHKQILAVLVVAGGITVGRKVQVLVKDAQRQQKMLCAEISAGRANSRKPQKIAVNKQFFKRLLVIMSICVPSPASKEAMLVLGQGALLLSRTLLTDWISKIEGACGSSLTSLQFEDFGRALVAFALVGIPAAIVNSGLKYMQKQLELAFQSRLTQYLHQQYCSNRAYYAASTLGGMNNSDQRITEDVEKFCFAVSDLYSHTFKPLLDVILFTRSLSRIMGYKGQLGLYGYYLIVAYVLRAMSPPLAAMTAQEAALSGSFRAAHQRLVAHAEEVAFNDPPAGAAEQLILNQHLRRLVQYSGLSAFQRAIQQVADGYFVKYFASVTALAVYGAPIYFADPAKRLNQSELTGDYIRSMRLLQNTSRGVGDLILVYKRITNLASHTHRVSELLEQVSALSREDYEHRELFRRNVSCTHFLGVTGLDASDPPPSPARLSGAHVAFNRVALDSPDGQPLFRELTFEVVPGRSVMLMGPNGCGKSSLFRVLAGLWPLQAGEITTPPPTKLFYLSQRPYLVAGSLRDQLLYPYSPPRAVWASASATEKSHFTAVATKEPPGANEESSPYWPGAAAPPMGAPAAPGGASGGGAAMQGSALDMELARCLRAVELEYLLFRGKGWDHVQPWNETLSGGEKQRLAMARLLFHRPTFAVLDECTSAVSADGEIKLYQECQKAGITFLSIAHRPALKRFHSVVVHFDGNVSRTGRGWWAESLDASAGGASRSSSAGTSSLNLAAVAAAAAAAPAAPAPAPAAAAPAAPLPPLPMRPLEAAAPAPAPAAAAAPAAAPAEQLQQQ